MLQLARTENKQSPYIISRVNYTHLYNQLKNALPPHLWQIFAKPDIGQNYTIWLVEEIENPASVQSFSSLHEEEQKAIADELEDKKEEILNILEAHPLLGEFAQKLFHIPEQDDIKLIQSDGEKQIMLTRWGCKKAGIQTEANPLTTVLAKASNNRSNVHIEVKYTDGDIASNHSFILSYKGYPKTYETDEYGKCSLGKFRHGSELTASFLYDGEERYQHQLIVDNRENYIIQIPKVGDVIINVVNQKLEPLEAQLEIRYKSELIQEKTNDEGIYTLHNLEQGESLQITASFQDTDGLIEEHQDFIIQNEDNQYTLILKQREAARLTVATVDQNGNFFSTALEISSPQGLLSVQTDASGKLYLDQFAVGDQLDVSATDFENSVFKHTIESADSELILKIVVPIPQFVIFKLIDHKNKPLEGINIDFKATNIEETKTTNTEANCLFPIESFTDGEKIKTKIYIPKKNKKGKVKTKVYKRTVKYDAKQSEYILKLKKRNWWWLLLLLLPLLLLIQCHKDVEVKTIDAFSKQPIATASVGFEYQQHNLFRPWGFFTTDSTRRDTLSDSIGIAAFPSLRYSLYSRLFYNKTKAAVFASCNCYQTDSIQKGFYSIKDTLVFELRPSYKTLDFLVVDSLDDEPLPLATVIMESEFAGGIHRDTALSDAAGMVYFKKVPSCAENFHILGEKYGYYPDSILAKQQAYLEGALEDKRKLKLVPETAKLEFFVEDCETGEPLGGATVIIDIDGKKRKQREMTNVNGKGKGEYGDARMTDEVELIAEYPPKYKPEKLPKYKVRDFIRLPKHLRTICLEPMPAPCNSQHKSGGAGVTIDEYNMEDPNLKFNISYNMFSVKDRMIVYCGRKGSVGKVLHDSGYTSGKNSFPIDLSQCSDTWITIKIVGPSGTDWNYQIDCIPQGLDENMMGVK
jgi:hypothetical protein